jgi:hypothetical protein
MSADYIQNHPWRYLESFLAKSAGGISPAVVTIHAAGACFGVN